MIQTLTSGYTDTIGIDLVADGTFVFPQCGGELGPSDQAMTSLAWNTGSHAIGRVTVALLLLLLVVVSRRRGRRGRRRLVVMREVRAIVDCIGGSGRNKIIG